jgi:hypothetical protein
VPPSKLEWPFSSLLGSRFFKHFDFGFFIIEFPMTKITPQKLISLAP